MKTIHIISHTHWDREWYRTFQQFRLRLVHLMDGLLDILERTPITNTSCSTGRRSSWTITCTCALKRKHPARTHPKGRILIGPWHILPDMFLVGPEAHIRNLLQGERTARVWSQDDDRLHPRSFGHPGQVPQILRGFGIDTACLWRGLSDQPAEFWWQSPDGSRS